MRTLNSVIALCAVILMILFPVSLVQAQVAGELQKPVTANNTNIPTPGEAPPLNEPAVQALNGLNDHQAVVFDLSGDVKIFKGKTEQWTPASKEMVLEAGDQILTGKESFLDIAYDSHFLNIARIKENTKAEFRSIEPTDLHMEDGTIFSALDGLKGSKYQITTPTAVAGVRGTTFDISSNGDVFVYLDSSKDEGKVELNLGTGTLFVTEGQGAVGGEITNIPPDVLSNTNTFMQNFNENYGAVKNEGMNLYVAAGFGEGYFPPGGMPSMYQNRGNAPDNDDDDSNNKTPGNNPPGGGNGGGFGPGTPGTGPSGNMPYTPGMPGMPATGATGYVPPGGGPYYGPAGGYAPATSHPDAMIDSALDDSGAAFNSGYAPASYGDGPAPVYGDAMMNFMRLGMGNYSGSGYDPSGGTTGGDGNYDPAAFATATASTLYQNAGYSPEQASYYAGAMTHMMAPAFYDPSTSSGMPYMGYMGGGNMPGMTDPGTTGGYYPPPVGAVPGMGMTAPAGTADNYMPPGGAFTGAYTAPTYNYDSSNGVAPTYNNYDPSNAYVAPTYNNYDPSNAYVAPTYNNYDPNNAYVAPTYNYDPSNVYVAPTYDPSMYTAPTYDPSYTYVPPETYMPPTNYTQEYTQSTYTPPGEDPCVAAHTC